MNNDNLKDLDSPISRGERLRRIRNMANLSREALCNTEGLNDTTYKGWEIGRFKGISEKGAINVIRRVSKEGVICSLDWLLHGQGQSPVVISMQNELETKQNDNTPITLQEIIVFQNNFDNTTYSEIVDDGVSPLYNIGDYVAGIKKYGKEISSIYGEICIVHTVNNQILVRQVLQGDAKKKHVLVCTNPNTTVEKAVLCNIEIHFAAPIKRHYKKIY